MGAQRGRAQRGLARGVAASDGERERRVAIPVPLREHGGGARRGAQQLNTGGVIIYDCPVQSRAA